MSRAPRGKRRATVLPERFSLDIERLAHGGDGVGRHDSGKIVFVAGALPGERVRVRTTEERKRFGRADLEAVERASELRRPNDCPHLERGCGGCDLRHVVDRAALRLKADAALGELAKLGRSVDWPDPVYHDADVLDGWRVRVRLHQRHGRLGFYARGTHELVEVVGRDGEPDCLAMHPTLRQATRLLAERISDLLPPQRPDELTLELADDGWVATHRDAGTIEIFAASSPTSADRSLELGGELRRPGTFGQASRHGNRVLHSLVAGWLEAHAPGATRIVDLYAGSGNFTAVAAASCPQAHIDAVEIGGDALAGLADTARRDGFDDRLTVHRADLRHGLPDTLTGPVDVVLLDPPRAGAAEVLDGVLALEPAHILYISCSPATLARDLEQLTGLSPTSPPPQTGGDVARGDRGGWQPAELHVVDMFPRTSHMEMAVRLQPVAR